MLAVAVGIAVSTAPGYERGAVDQLFRWRKPIVVQDGEFAEQSMAKASERISWRDVLLGMGVVLGAAGLGGGVGWWASRQAAQNLQDQETTRLGMLVRLTETDLRSARSDLLELVTGDATRDYLASGAAPDLERAVARALFYSRLRTDFDYLRYLDAQGREIFRVDGRRSRGPGKPSGNDAGQSYFQKTVALPAGAIHVSLARPDAGRDAGPVASISVLMSTPVLDSRGRLQGVYSVGYSGTNLLARLRSVEPRFGHRLQVYHLPGLQRRAADNPGLTRPAADQPAPADLWARVGTEPSGHARRAGGLLTWQRVTLDPPGTTASANTANAGNELLILASEVSGAEWTATFAGLHQRYLVLTLAMLALAAASLWFSHTRRRAEAHLRESEDRARLIVESVKDYAIIMLDPNGQVVSWNEGARRIKGYAAHEIIGRHFSCFFPESIARSGALEQALEQAAARGSAEFEGWRLRKDGSQFWADVVITALRNPRGVLVGFAKVTRDLTEQRRAREELDRFFSISLDLLCIANAVGFKRVSPAVTDVLGWTPEEFVSRPFIEFVHPDDRAATLAEVNRQLSTGTKVLRFENRYRHKDGSWRVLSWRSIPQPDGLMYATARDVTERVEFESALVEAKEQLESRVRERTADLAAANETLRESERRFRALIEHGTDSIVLTDPGHRVLYRSPGGSALGGAQAARMVGPFAPEQLHPDDGPQVQAVMDQLLAAPGEPVPIVWRRRHDDGRWIWLEGVATNLLDDPAVRAVVTNYRDVTERKQAEARAAWLASFPERNPSPIVEIDADGSRCRYVNPTARRLFPDLETAGRRHPLLAGLDDAAGPLIGGVAAEIRREVAVGGRWYAQTLNYIADEQRLRIYSTDITERREAEQAIRDLNTDLERRVERRTQELKEANQELEAFSYSVSHDLRSPLRHIDGYVELLTKDMSDGLSEKSRRYLRIVAESAGQMGRLIDDLLAFSRMGRVDLHSAVVDLGQLVPGIIADLQADTSGRNIAWRCHRLPSVQGDPSMVKQVLVNLLSNAVKYTGRKDPAVIETGCARETEDEAVIYVRDNGAGFEMKYVHKLFGVFQRLHRSEDYEGTGVGLAIVRRIVNRHGGRVWAEGAPGQGATFYFALSKPKKG